MALRVGDHDNRLRLTKNNSSGDYSLEVSRAAEQNSAAAGGCTAGTYAAAISDEPAEILTDELKGNGSAKKVANQHAEPINGSTTKTQSGSASEPGSSASDLVPIWPEGVPPPQSSQQKQQPTQMPLPVSPMVPSGATLEAV